MTTGFASRPVSAQDGSLLLYCLGIRPDGRASAPLSPPSPTDWAEVLRQAGVNGVTPLLYHLLTTTTPAAPVPRPVLELLRKTSVRSAAQSLQIGRELAQVLDALRGHGIPVIVLKGAYLGQVVYGSFALRTMCDLDVMIRRADLSRASEVLTALGYAPQYYGVEEVDYARHHHLRPVARPGGMRIEIHWSIARPNPAFDIDVEGLWDRAQRVEVAGVEALVLSVEDLLLHLCLHASFTHKFQVGLRACWDVLEVVRHYGDAVDWDQLVRRAQQWRIGRYVYLTLRLARELLAVDIPVAAIASLEPPRFPAEVLAWSRTCIFALESDTSVSPSLARLWTSQRLAAKLTVLRNTFCPSRTTMARIYSAPPKSTRIYLYYPVRWVDLLLRYGRHAWGLWRGDDRAHDQLRALSERAALSDWLAAR